MAPRKHQDELLAPVTPRAREWGICQSCGMERRLDGEVVVEHRAWTLQRAMVRCSGSGEVPARVTA